MKITVSELNLNVCGILTMCRRDQKPLLVTTRRKATHVILPVCDERQGRELISCFLTLKQES